MRRAGTPHRVLGTLLAGWWRVDAAGSLELLDGRPLVARALATTGPLQLGHPRFRTEVQLHHPAENPPQSKGKAIPSGGGSGMCCINGPMLLCP